MIESGPDYTGYYKHRILELFVRNESSLLLPSQNSQLHTDIPSGAAKFKDIRSDVDENMDINVDSDSGLFSSELGEHLSVFDKDMLKTILQECVVVLNQEVEEVLENFVELNCTHSHLDKKTPASPFSVTLVEEDRSPAHKKHRVTQEPVNMSTETDCSRSNGQDCQSLLSLPENGCLQSEEATESHSVKFCAKLKHMEEQLDEFLDILVSKCRPMTHPEKVQLQWLIQQLPAEALDRVVDILGKRSPSVSKCSEQINVELENEDHVTLWRLYYYVRAVSNARQ